MKKKIIITIVLCFFLFSLLIACETEENEEENAPEESSLFEKTDIENIKITSDNCNVKSGSGDNFKSIGKLNKNQLVNVTKELDDWYLVQLDNNEVGAVKKSDAKPVVVDEEKQKDIKDQDKDKTNQNQANQAKDEITNENETPNANNTPSNQTAESSNKLVRSENTMIDLVNKERQKNNLQALKMDTEVTKVARIKSQDMVDNDYFSHYSPNYGSPFDMMKSFGIKYVHAGENLAGNNSVESAHKALMNSSGHRKNILSPDFTHIGIGVKNSDKYGYVFTQMFISKPE